LRITTDSTALSLTLVDRAPDARSLTPGDRAAHDALPPVRRADFRSGRKAARGALHGLLPGIRAWEIDLEPRFGDAPRVALRTGPASDQPVVHLSITHRDGRAAAAASFQRAGVDLERAGSVARAHRRYFLTRAEQAITGYDVTELWSLKEAAWKALELGHGMPFTALELGVGPAGTVASATVGGRSWALSASVHPLANGHLLAVVRLGERT
jgi:phosphopantetheinyl transferase (holo-ACP synthase)